MNSTLTFLSFREPLGRKRWKPEVDIKHKIKLYFLDLKEKAMVLIHWPLNLAKIWFGYKFFGQQKYGLEINPLKKTETIIQIFAANNTEDGRVTLQTCLSENQAFQIVAGSNFHIMAHNLCSRFCRSESTCRSSLQSVHLHLS